MQNKIREYFFKNLDKFIVDTSTIVVALSGGSDSICLTLLANEWAILNKKKLIAVTIDHRLREESAQEAEKVHSKMKELGICHVIKPWLHGDIPINKLENLAREARYKILVDFCRENNARFLLLGHNLDDQIETFLMRKDKKSGCSGLASMSVIRSISNDIFIVRPCLGFSKSAMREYLNSKGISWVEDPMNVNDVFLRVKFRKLLSKMSKSDIQLALDELLVHGKRREEVEAKAVEFLKKFCKLSNFGFASINYYELFSLRNDEIKYEVLKRVIRCIGGKKYNISDSECNRVMSSDYSISVGNVFFKKIDNDIFFIRENRNLPIEKVTSNSLIWDSRFKVDFSVESGNKDLEIGAYGEKRCIPRLMLNEKKILPSYIVETLPALFVDKKAICVYNDNEAVDKFACKFLPKVDFLDVFCCIDKSGVLL